MKEKEIELMKSILRKVLSLREKDLLVIGVKDTCNCNKTNYWGQEMCSWENFYIPQLTLEVNEVYFINSLEECKGEECELERLNNERKTI